MYWEMGNRKKIWGVNQYDIRKLNFQQETREYRRDTIRWAPFFTRNRENCSYSYKKFLVWYGEMRFLKNSSIRKNWKQYPETGTMSSQMSSNKFFWAILIFFVLPLNVTTNKPGKKVVVKESNKRKDWFLVQGGDYSDTCSFLDGFICLMP